jgi:hypothetical protein
MTNTRKTKAAPTSPVRCAEAWQEATAQDFDAVEALCSTPECVQWMKKVLTWSWFLLDGGRCNDAAGRHPDLHNLPDRPEETHPHVGFVDAQRVALQSDGLGGGRVGELRQRVDQGGLIGGDILGSSCLFQASGKCNDLRVMR